MVILTFFGIPVFDILAQTGFDPFTSSEEFGEVIKNVAEWIAKIGLPFATLAILWSGFRITAARGNEEELKNAKKMLFWSVVGAGILVGAWAIAGIVVDFAQSLLES
ncbi:pilin [Patescibacteria group bacterium]